MKIILILLMFFVLIALLVINNFDISFSSQTDFKEFSKIYLDWIIEFFQSIKNIELDFLVIFK